MREPLAGCAFGGTDEEVAREGRDSHARCSGATVRWKPAFRVGTDYSPGSVTLVRSTWDDWFEFETMFYATYLDPEGVRWEIGNVKIGEFGLQPKNINSYDGKKGFRSPSLDRRFAAIGADQFSLGQDTSYYENLTKIGGQFRLDYLTSMNDIALDRKLFERAQTERVTRISLLRDTPLSTVRDQLARLAVGKPKLTPYDFKFALNQKSTDAEPFELRFQ